MDANHPIAGVDIILVDATGTKASSSLTDYDGSFIVSYLTPGTYTVETPGYWLAVPVQVVVPPNGAATGVSVVVNRGGIIEGTVRQSTDGAPLAGATIQANGGGLSFSATTSADGTYILSGLPAGSFSVSAGGDSFVGQQISAVASTPGQPTTGIDFALTLGATVQGLVTSGGAPLAGATVTVVSPSGAASSATTDAEGHYLINDVPPGPATIRAEANGRDPRQRVDRVSAQGRPRPPRR